MLDPSGNKEVKKELEGENHCLFTHVYLFNFGSDVS